MTERQKAAIRRALGWAMALPFVITLISFVLVGMLLHYDVFGVQGLSRDDRVGLLVVVIVLGLFGCWLFLQRLTIYVIQQIGWNEIGMTEPQWMRKRRR